VIATEPRECLKTLTAYLPGKPIGEVERELGLRGVIKLASNENPLGPSPRALAAVRRWASKAHLYPEGASPLLKQRLARELGVESARIVIGNGSDEVIRLVCLAFVSEGDPVVVSQYGFIRFRQAAGLMGARVTEVPMRAWRHDLAAMSEACTARTRVVFVASPNNPTGTFNTELELRRFLDGVPPSTLVVLDEAYWHYARGSPAYHSHSIPTLTHAHPNLIVVRTFSKAYGLAGLRVGYGVADPEVVRILERIRMPFNVNLLAQHAAEAALSDHAFLRRSVRLVAKERSALRAALNGLGLVTPESAANFLFVDSGRPAESIFQDLLRRGVIVRPLGEYGLARHLRITVGTPSQNRRLLAALHAVLATESRGWRPATRNTQHG